MINKLIDKLSHKNRMRLLSIMARVVICSPMLLVVGVAAWMWN